MYDGKNFLGRVYHRPVFVVIVFSSVTTRRIGRGRSRPKKVDRGKLILPPFYHFFSRHNLSVSLNFPLSHSVFFSLSVSVLPFLYFRLRICFCLLTCLSVCLGPSRPTTCLSVWWLPRGSVGSGFGEGPDETRFPVGSGERGFMVRETRAM